MTTRSKQFSTNTGTLQHGEKSISTIPLILELIDKGQGKEVFELLHSVGLKVKEKDSLPGFTIYT
jgi:hypothetical protein